MISWTINPSPLLFHPNLWRISNGKSYNGNVILKIWHWHELSYANLKCQRLILAFILNGIAKIALNFVNFYHSFCFLAAGTLLKKWWSYLTLTIGDLTLASLLFFFFTLFLIISNTVTQPTMLSQGQHANDQEYL